MRLCVGGGCLRPYRQPPFPRYRAARESCSGKLLRRSSVSPWTREGVVPSSTCIEKLREINRFDIEVFYSLDNESLIAAKRQNVEDRGVKLIGVPSDGCGRFTIVGFQCQLHCLSGIKQLAAVCNDKLHDCCRLCTAARESHRVARLRILLQNRIASLARSRLHSRGVLRT